MSYGIRIQIEKLDYLLYYGKGWVTSNKKSRRDRRYYSHSRKKYKKSFRRWLRNQYKKDLEINLEKSFSDFEY